MGSLGNVNIGEGMDSLVKVTFFLNMLFLIASFFNNSYSFLYANLWISFVFLGVWYLMSKNKKMMQNRVDMYR